MDKFLIVERSGNRTTGPMMVTTSPRSTCPLSCPLRKGGGYETAGVCYAEYGYLGGFIWTGLDKARPGTKIYGRQRVYTFNELLAKVRNLPHGAVWRHNQAGDLPSDDNVTIRRDKLQALTEANKGRLGFTYTHYDVLTNSLNYYAVRQANQNGFTVNLSADDLDEADALADLNIAPVAVVVPSDMTENAVTPKGRKVVICPYTAHPNVTCLSCKLCTFSRRPIIAFPATGAKKHRLI